MNNFEEKINKINENLKVQSLEALSEKGVFQIKNPQPQKYESAKQAIVYKGYEKFVSFEYNRAKDEYFNFANETEGKIGNLSEFGEETTVVYSNVGPIVKTNKFDEENNSEITIYKGMIKVKGEDLEDKYVFSQITKTTDVNQDGQESVTYDGLTELFGKPCELKETSNPEHFDEFEKENGRSEMIFEKFEKRFEQEYNAIQAKDAQQATNIEFEQN